MRKMNLAAVLALFSLGAPALADGDKAHDWVRVSQAQGSNVGEFIDMSSLERDGDRVRYVHRSDYEDDPEGWQSAETDQEADCKANKLRILRIRVTYDNGKTKNAEGSGKWLDVPDNSVASDIIGAVCKTE